MTNTVTQVIVEIAGLYDNNLVTTSQLVVECAAEKNDHLVIVEQIVLEVACLYTPRTGRVFGPALQCGG